jgi:hypothetical protein
VLNFHVSITPPVDVSADARLFLSGGISFEYDDQAAYTGSACGFWALPTELETVLKWATLPAYGDIEFTTDAVFIRGVKAPSEVASWANDHLEKHGYGSYWEGFSEYSGEFPSGIFGIEEFYGTANEWKLLCAHPLTFVVDENTEGRDLAKSVSSFVQIECCCGSGVLGAATVTA